MAAMTKAFEASVVYLEEYRAALGTITASAIETEFKHLQKLFRNEASAAGDRSETTEVIRRIRTTASPFSQEQKTTLIEIAAATLKDDELGEVNMNNLHGGQKSQTHMHSYNYYTEEDWAYFFSKDHTLSDKLKHMSKRWLSFGLKYPSGPTFRVGLATVCAASEQTLESQHAHSLLKEFVDEFRVLRTIVPSEPARKSFPRDVEEFCKAHPGVLINPVPCRVDLMGIRELDNKRRIPIKSNNAQISRSRVSSSSASSSENRSSSDQNQLISALLARVLGEPSHRPTASLSPSPSPSPRASHRVEERGRPLAIADRSMPAVRDIESSEPEMPACRREPGRSAPDLSTDAIASLAMQYSRNAQATRRRARGKQPPPTGQKRTRTREDGKVAAAENDGEHHGGDTDETDAEDADDDESMAEAIPATAQQAAGTVLSAASKQSAAAAAVQPAAAKQTRMPRPASAIQPKRASAKHQPASAKKTRPPLDMENTVHWGGGKLYAYRKRNCFRVWARYTDRKDKTISFGKNPTTTKLNDKWQAALDIIAGTK